MKFISSAELYMNNAANPMHVQNCSRDSSQHQGMEQSHPQQLEP
jgi:hypothetical protein